MTTLAQGTSATLTLGDGGAVVIATNGGMGSITITPTVGTVVSQYIGPLPVRQTFGPYSEGASVELRNQTAVMDYDVGGGSSQSSVSGVGSVTIDATRVDQTLSDAERQADQLVFTGELAADATFDVGSSRRRRVVDAQTSGTGRLLLKFGSAGAAFPVPNNETVEVQ